MSNISRLIIGLGNPGNEYVTTRHNVGFQALDTIALHYATPPWKKKFRSLVTRSEDLLLLKPQTFMNLSGEAALEAMNFYELMLDQVVVFHDDLDLLPGQIKVKQGGGSAGHNGLKSLDALIGPDYWRVRIGIGRPLTEQGEPIKGDAVTHYVLNSFSKTDKVWLIPLLKALAAEFNLVLHQDYAGYAKKISVLQKDKQ